MQIRGAIKSKMLRFRLERKKKRKQNATLSSRKKKKRKKIKFQAISFAILHNMNGVYLFYGLFRAEPTGGPKISTRRKRRTGRASE